MITLSPFLFDYAVLFCYGNVDNKRLDVQQSLIVLLLRIPSFIPIGKVQINIFMRTEYLRNNLMKLGKPVEMKEIIF